MIVLDVLRLEKNDISSEIKRLLNNKTAYNFNRCFNKLLTYYLNPGIISCTNSIKQSINYIECCLDRLNNAYANMGLPAVEPSIPNTLNLLKQIETEMPQ